MNALARRLTALALALAFLAFGAAVYVAQDAQAGTTAGDWIGTDVTASDDVTVGDDLVVTDDASVGGDLTVTGALTFGGEITWHRTFALSSGAQTKNVSGCSAITSIAVTVSGTGTTTAKAAVTGGTFTIDDASGSSSSTGWAQGFCTPS